MSPRFLVEIKHSGSITIINVEGEVDVYTGHELGNVFRQVIDNGDLNFILNLENTNYIDSTGLGIIAYAARNISEKEGKINVINVKPQVKKIFDMSGLSKKNINFFDEELDAVRDLT